MTIFKTLVIGATGRIGSILRKSWLHGGASWQARRQQEGINWQVFDPLTAPKSLAQAAQGCDRILCLAGSIPGRHDDLQDNTRLAESVIRAGAKVGAQVLLSSSVAVYGAQAGMLHEATQRIPITPYGQAKKEMEVRGQVLGAELGVPVTALRIANVAGCDAILGGWRPGFTLDQFADGTTPRRSYIGPTTLARVLWDLVQAPKLPEALNVAVPGAVQMGALLDAAGLSWSPRQAPDSAIAQVEVATDALSAFTPLDPEASLPSTLIREWRSQIT